MYNHHYLYHFNFFRYGKTAKNKTSSYLVVRAIEIPKKNFLHFYIFASILTTFLLYQAFQVNWNIFRRDKNFSRFLEEIYIFSNFWWSNFQMISVLLTKSSISLGLFDGKFSAWLAYQRVQSGLHRSKSRFVSKIRSGLGLKELSLSKVFAKSY